MRQNCQENEVILPIKNGRALRRAIVPGIAALGLLISGCSSDNTSGGGSGLSGTVAGGGSSAQETAQESWRAGFGQDNPDVKLSYDPVGSGTGRENFISGSYAYAGSDSAMTSDELASAAKTCGGDPVQVPV